MSAPESDDSPSNTPPASSHGPVSVIVVPIQTKTDEHSLLLPASVLGSWFDVPVQLLTPYVDQQAHLQAVTDSLGVQTLPVAVLDAPSFAEGVIKHVETSPGALCVTSASETGFSIARNSIRPTYVSSLKERKRLQLGPLVLELDRSSDSNTNILATAATWAAALEIGVRIVIPNDPACDRALSESARAQLRSLGLDAGIDELRPHGLDPAVLVARTRQAIAIVVPQDRVDDEKLSRLAVRQGISVLVAPSPQGSLAGTGLDLEKPAEPEEALTPKPRRLEKLSDVDCWKRLAKAGVGRIAYVDHGWPTVLPVNFTASDGDLFIRSLDGGKASAAKRGDLVCLEVDDFDAAHGDGWSVLARGPLQLVTDPETLARAWANDPHPFVAAHEWHWLKLTPIAVTGRVLIDGS